MPLTQNDLKLLCGYFRLIYVLFHAQTYLLAVTVWTYSTKVTSIENWLVKTLEGSKNTQINPQADLVRGPIAPFVSSPEDRRDLTGGPGGMMRYPMALRPLCFTGAEKAAHLWPPYSFSSHPKHHPRSHTTPPESYDILSLFVADIKSEHERFMALHQTWLSSTIHRI